MKNKLVRCVFLAALGCGFAMPAAAGDLKIYWTQSGRVTVIAQDVPLRQILQEWSRIGQTKIVNLEKLTGPAVTLQLVNVPERDALDTLLRNASGYIAAPRPDLVANASVYDRIMILATSRAPAAVPVAQAPPTFQRPPVAAPTEDDEEPVNVNMPPGMTMPPQPGQPGAPGVSPFPGAPPQQMQQPMAPGQQAPVTSPRPGVLPGPAQPNGVQNPYQPSVVTPVRPGGPGGPGGMPLSSGGLGPVTPAPGGPGGPGF